MTTQKKLFRIAQKVIQTPTPSNCQPWKIVIDECGLDIFHESKRAKFATLPDDLSVFGLGLISAALELAGGKEGMQTQITPFLENRADDTPWLRAEFSPTELAEEPSSHINDLLASALFQRHTDRRGYVGGSLADPVFQEAAREAETTKGANLYFIDQYPEDYLQLTHEADLAFLGWPELRRDFMKWARFTDKEIAKTRDGDSWRDLLGEKKNLGYYIRLYIWGLTKKRGGVPGWLQKMAPKFVDKLYQLSPVSYNDGAGIGCITTQSASTEELLASGRLAMRIWLLFNARNYAFQPLCNITMFVYSQHRGFWNLPSHLTHHFVNAYSCMQSTFAFSEHELPVFCFRTGLPVGEYPQNERTLRRHDRITQRQSD